MSAIRDAVLQAIREILPAAYGDDRFAAIAPGYVPREDSKVTTCGYFPAFIARKVGLRGAIASGGLEGLRTAARANGSWVDATGDNRPEPGDVYGLSDTPGGGLVHVGWIVDPSGDIWETADAGQGVHMHPEAKYVKRRYDAKNVTLGGVLGPRHLAGWVNLDAYVAAESQIPSPHPGGKGPPVNTNAIKGYLAEVDGRYEKTNTAIESAYIANAAGRGKPLPFPESEWLRALTAWKTWYRGTLDTVFGPDTALVLTDDTYKQGIRFDKIQEDYYTELGSLAPTRKPTAIPDPSQDPPLIDKVFGSGSVSTLAVVGAMIVGGLVLLRK